MSDSGDKYDILTKTKLAATAFLISNMYYNFRTIEAISTNFDR